MIAFDIDGVISDTDSLIRKEVLNNHGLNLLVDDNGWFHLKNKTEEETNLIINNIIRNKIHLVEPFPSVFSFLEFFYYILDEVPLIFVSARSPCVQKITENWFKKYFDKDIKFIINCIGSHNKVPIIKELNNKFNNMFFVEDNPTIAKNLINEISDLSGVYLINNSRIKKELNMNEKIIKCKNLKEVFENYVNKLSF